MCTQKIITLLITSTLVLSAPIASAKTHRTAKVNVYNYSADTISWVSVAHKYSDNYKDSKVWLNLPPNTQTFPHAMEANFNTGFGTTGQDWWIVSWQWKNETCVTNPNNFRGVIDGMEDIASAKILFAAAADFGNYVRKNSNPEVGQAVDDAVFVYTAKPVRDAMFNAESTVGFKKHFLTEKDTGGFGVYMDIYGNGKLRINSPSGTSWTVYKCTSVKKSAPPEPIKAPPAYPVEAPPRPLPPIDARRPMPNPDDVAKPRPVPLHTDSCKQGYVWREATPGDKVCVTGAERDAANIQNRNAQMNRSPTGGDYGNDTCKYGYVWREANRDDHVCVTGQEREIAKQQNASHCTHANSCN